MGDQYQELYIYKEDIIVRPSKRWWPWHQSLHKCLLQLLWSQVAVQTYFNKESSSTGRAHVVRMSRGFVAVSLSWAFFYSEHIIFYLIENMATAKNGEIDRTHFRSERLVSSRFRTRERTFCFMVHILLISMMNMVRKIVIWTCCFLLSFPEPFTCDLR